MAFLKFSWRVIRAILIIVAVETGILQPEFYGR